MKVRYFKEDIGLAMVEGSEAAAIIAIEKLNLLMGEWYRDGSVGIPWLTDIIGNKLTNATSNYVCNCISGALYEIPGVTSVDFTEVSFDEKTRKLFIKVTMKYLDQDIELEQSYGV